MNPLAFIVGPVLEGIKTIFGSKQERDQQAADDQAALRQQFAAEFRTGGTWWDSLVDGLNRLVRPTFTFGTIALFVWCVFDPMAFTVAMTALQAVPEAMWVILGTIVVFWFGGKTLEGIRAPKVSTSAAAAVISQMKEIQAMREPDPVPAEPISDRAYQNEIADTSKPMSLPAIEEWNRRRQGGAP